MRVYVMGAHLFRCMLPADTQRMRFGKAVVSFHTRQAHKSCVCTYVYIYIYIYIYIHRPSVYLHGRCICRFISACILVSYTANSYAQKLAVLTRKMSHASRGNKIRVQRTFSHTDRPFSVPLLRMSMCLYVSFLRYSRTCDSAIFS
jgi:hypothetical protein